MPSWRSREPPLQTVEAGEWRADHDYKKRSFKVDSGQDVRAYQQPEQVLRRLDCRQE
jgi:hypothetical protein